MLDMFNNDEKSVGIMCLVCTVLWGLIAIYTFYIFILARKQYSLIGGLQRAKKEAAREAGKQAAENPEFVKSTLSAAV